MRDGVKTAILILIGAFLLNTLWGADYSAPKVVENPKVASIPLATERETN